MARIANPHYRYASFDGLKADTGIKVDGRDGTIAKLQLARASAIRQFLIERGIDPNRITVGNGKIELGSASSTLQIINP